MGKRRRPYRQRINATRFDVWKAERELRKANEKHTMEVSAALTQSVQQTFYLALMHTHGFVADDIAKLQEEVDRICNEIGDGRMTFQAVKEQLAENGVYFEM